MAATHRFSSILSITTPIFYVNASNHYMHAYLYVTLCIELAIGPHLGHAYSMVLADAIARDHSLRYTMESKLYTGTDEYGQKVRRS